MTRLQQYYTELHQDAQHRALLHWKQIQRENAFDEEELEIN